ncbi:MAG: FAD-dependent oxidoreductase [Eubacterium sp.]|nr:FAD-dependent oxidoreductase [Eubacterium sp.]
MLELGQIKIEYNELIKAVDELMGVDTNDRPSSEASLGYMSERTKAEREYLKEITAKRLKVSSDILRRFEISKRSLDARRKPELFYVYGVRFIADDEEAILKKNRNNRSLRMMSKPPVYDRKLTQIKPQKEKRIVVIGAGPAGLFSAYALSMRGLRPVIIERGGQMEERIEEVERFWDMGELDPECNVCFGEGGAGTFSDGKLNSGVKDRDGAKRFILETFVRFGACRDIMYDAKPHIGTDVLRDVMVKMRHAMEKQGVTFLFNSCVQKLDLEEKNSAGGSKTSVVSGVWVKNNKTGEVDVLPCSHVVLAIGHSARDTFLTLFKQGVKMTSKAFAVGVRVQHRQSDIDRAQYGEQKTVLPAAYYKLTGKANDGRGVYSFCMCPGGFVVNSSTEEGHLVVNGMSNADRESGYANAAIVVTVDPKSLETPEDDVFAGMRYQAELEKSMFDLADGYIPVQRFRDFREASGSDQEDDVFDEIDLDDAGDPHSLKITAAPKGTGTMGKLSSNQPSVRGLWKYADVGNAMPKDIVVAVTDAITQFGRKIQGFDDDDTLVIGVESRTSSPVRIVRDEKSLQSVSISGLYPCGEGAGYAGGILSAAMDGLRVSEVIGDEMANSACLI